MASVGRQSTFRRQPGLAHDNGLDGEIKEGILAAGRHLGRNARAVEAFVVAVAARPLQSCGPPELNRLLVAHVELALTLRAAAGYQAGHGAVSASDVEVI
jgi:hypothetical protein